MLTAVVYEIMNVYTWHGRVFDSNLHLKHAQIDLFLLDGVPRHRTGGVSTAELCFFLLLHFVPTVDTADQPVYPLGDPGGYTKRVSPMFTNAPHWHKSTEKEA